MAKYRITAPDGNSYEVTAPDSASQNDVLNYAKSNYTKAAQPSKGKELLNMLVQGGKQSLTRPYTAAKSALMNPGAVASQAPMGGAAIGSAFAPGLGTAAGAGLGSILQQMYQVGSGQRKQGSPVEAMMQAGGSGLMENPGVLKDIPGVPKVIQGAKRLAQPLGNGLAKVGEMLSNVPARQFQRLAKDPKALFIPKTFKMAGKDYGSALAKEGIDVTPTAAEVNDPQLTIARKNANLFFDRMKNGIKTDIKIPKFNVQESEIVPKEPMGIRPTGRDELIANPPNIRNEGAVTHFSRPEQEAYLKEPVKKIKTSVTSEPYIGKYKPTPGEVLKTRRATDRIISGTPWKDKDGLHNLYNQRSQLNEMFENLSGPGAEASKQYGRSALASNFRKLLPETQTGKLSYVRNILAPLGVRTAILPLTSPAVLGGLTAGGSIAAKQIAKNPSLRQALFQALMKMRKKDQ